MRSRYAIVGAASAIMLIAACGDDEGGGTRTIAKGDVEFVGSDGLGEQSMDIEAIEEDGEVTGEARFNEVVLDLQCADPDAGENRAVIGGEVTRPSGDNTPAVGDGIAVIIEDGDPDRVTLWFGDDPDATCDELLASIPDDATTDDKFTDVESGDLELG